MKIFRLALFIAFMCSMKDYCGENQLKLVEIIDNEAKTCLSGYNILVSEQGPLACICQLNCAIEKFLKIMEIYLNAIKEDESKKNEYSKKAYDYFCKAKNLTKMLLDRGIKSNEHYLLKKIDEASPQFKSDDCKGSDK